MATGAPRVKSSCRALANFEARRRAMRGAGRVAPARSWRACGASSAAKRGPSSRADALARPGRAQWRLDAGVRAVRSLADKAIARQREHRLRLRRARYPLGGRPGRACQLPGEVHCAVDTPTAPAWSPRAEPTPLAPPAVTAIGEGVAEAISRSLPEEVPLPKWRGAPNDSEPHVTVNGTARPGRVSSCGARSDRRCAEAPIRPRRPRQSRTPAPAA